MSGGGHAGQRATSLDHIGALPGARGRAVPSVALAAPSGSSSCLGRAPLSPPPSLARSLAR
eukprot:351246-Pyramimonas_sp.AAC.1